MTTIDEPARTASGPPIPHAMGALSGLLAAGAGVAAGEASARWLGGPSPVEAVGTAVVDSSPSWLREWAIATLGSADKPVLLGGIVAVVAVVAAVVGALGVRRPGPAVAATAALGAVAFAAAATGRAGVGTSVVERLGPSSVTLVVVVVAMSALLLALRTRPGDPDDSQPVDAEVEPRGAGFEVVSTEPFGVDRFDRGVTWDRRRFLGTALAVGAVGAAGAVVAGRPAGSTPAVSAVPVPIDPAPAVPTGAALAEPGTTPFHTPNDGFYRVDTNLRIPRVDARTWQLRVHGMVERELVLDLDGLLARPMVERDITLTCVSNEVGGPYVGTARWIGARLDELLAECGVLAGADAVLSTAVDGFTVGTPLEALTDGRDALLAVAMNGEPLPPAHGYPVRMVVPGLYGYVSATKWVVDLEVTRFAEVDAYWTTRGWAEQAPIKTSSRIDHPRYASRLNAGPITVAGVAWAQHRGISAVEVRVDDGPWQSAELAAEATIDTWRQWRWQWDATVGRHEIFVRATDATGATQTEDRAAPAPDGSTGWHSVVVDVFDGVPTGPPAGGAPAGTPGAGFGGSDLR